MYFGLIVPAYGYAYFSTTIIQTYRYSPIQSKSEPLSDHIDELLTVTQLNCIPFRRGPAHGHLL